MNILNSIGEYIKNNDIQNAYTLIIDNESDYSNNSEYWNLKGILCLKLEEYNTATTCFEKALDIDRLNGDVLYNYAYALEHIGCISDAALYYGLAYRYVDNLKLKEELINLCTHNKELKNIFDVAANSKQKTFVILSSCGWGDIYQRMHHISRSLVKYGHEVIYIEPGVMANIIEGEERLNISELTKYSWDNLRVVDGVNILQPLIVNKKDNSVIINYNNLVQNVLDVNSLDKETVIITYLPYQVNVIKSVQGNFFHIYDCVDDHTDLEYAFWGHKKDVLWEQELMETADVITTTSLSLYLQRSANEKRNNVFLSRNAVNEIDFVLKNNEMPNDIKDIPEPRIVYVGALYERFDTELFYSVVKNNPDKSFVVIGFGSTELLAESLPNLYFLGAKGHGELKEYLVHMQVGVVPFKDYSDIVINCDSIKQYEYIACNLPVVTTFMPDSAIGKPYVFLANKADQFTTAINNALEIKVDRDVINNFIAENSWNARAALLYNLSEGIISEREMEIEFCAVGEQLHRISLNYDSPIFDIMYGVYLNIQDTKQFELIAKQAYERQQIKYIERQYLRVLIFNGNFEVFNQVISESIFVAEEIKQELNYRNQDKQLDYISPLAYLCFNDVDSYVKAIPRLYDKSVRVLYQLYAEFIYDEKVIRGRDFYDISNEVDQKSPIYLFLKKAEKLTYIVDLDNDLSDEYLQLISSSNLNVNGYCTHHKIIKEGLEVISLRDLIELKNSNEMIKIIVPFNNEYVKQVRELARSGITECNVLVDINSNMELVYIDKELMSKIMKKEYLTTISFNKFNAADSNIGALLKYMPNEYKDKYKINIIYGRDVWSLEQTVRIPLISSYTVSGFATFLYNPKFTYNIDVGHAGISIKACGIMDKKDKRSGGDQQVFENVDIVCTASHMHNVVFSSFYAIPENKYEITGLPRNDMLTLSKSRENLTALLGVDISDKKIIFNMPTFHVFDEINRVEGSHKLNDNFKILDFNYEQFDAFLEDNNMICISKPHHGEETSISHKNEKRLYNNLFFINNDNLEKNDLDLYEILGAGDILITDYSTIYNDFLFMNKPTIFVNTDIEEYRKERGLILEPYDFWMAGPKVQLQKDLQDELIKCCVNVDYYREERERLLPVFFESSDANSVNRTWKVIDNAISKKNNEFEGLN
ncbi:CDP-glycerol glycerophosphotransferase family protein [Paenibacillus sp. IHBB 10380]|uniref:CDP-glycerol glycerophosphotransferase family protein n=1 Tax=Paenibacillus sp. IHBB 10380 TaxID=1566358 RepID=UPI0005CFBEF9|nr:CDP-glycerol glycerophosphotransferase family protein [Paenibacillus sp. IHBB 10380]AJS60369.1 hypothetical protein UB51_20105 [Paenibacillus sp. IHBB 10380]